MVLYLLGWVQSIHVSTCWYSNYQKLHIKRLTLYKDNILYCHISAVWAINWDAKRYLLSCYFTFSCEYFEQAATCFVQFSFHIFPKKRKLLTLVTDLFHILVFRQWINKQFFFKKQHPSPPNNNSQQQIKENLLKTSKK